MTSATARPTSSADERREDRGLGRVYSAAILLLVAVDVVALYGLRAYGSRENVSAAA